jgi:hypothetical protein
MGESIALSTIEKPFMRGILVHDFYKILTYEVQYIEFLKKTFGRRNWLSHECHKSHNIHDLLGN